MTRDDNFYKWLTWGLLIFGGLLRVVLYLANPPTNAFDDHFEPLFMLINSGHLPASDACWECQQPPLFYIISAALGKLALSLGTGKLLLLKILQFMPLSMGLLLCRSSTGY